MQQQLTAYLKPGNMLGIDRGYASPSLLEVLNKAGGSYIYTHKRILSFAFTTDAVKAAENDNEFVSESGLRVDSWARRNVCGHVNLLLPIVRRAAPLLAHWPRMSLDSVLGDSVLTCQHESAAKIMLQGLTRGYSQRG
jgi:hypothetical protein